MIAVVERLLALLAVVAAVAGVTGLVLLATGRAPAWVRGQVALPLAAAIAVVATAGSLFASEVAGYPPCVLCWVQRGAMYPLAVILGLATVRGGGARVLRVGLWRVGVSLAAAGAAVAAWHVVIERLPAAGGVCSAEAPCSVRWIEELGVMTLPSMALIGFLAIIVLLLLARPRPRGLPTRDDEGPHAELDGRPRDGSASAAGSRSESR